MTKLNFILFGILYCTAITTFGQSKIDIGAEAGPSYIFLRGNYNPPPALGFSGGLSFQCNLGNHKNHFHQFIGLVYRMGS